MPPYRRTEARDWAREKLAGAVNCTIPSFTDDLTALNEAAIRHDVRLAKEHGFLGTLGVAEVSITLPEYLDFLGIAKDEAGADFYLVHHASWNTLEQNMPAREPGDEHEIERLVLADDRLGHLIADRLG